MIFDHIDNAARFEAISPLVAQALAFVRRADLAELPVGRYEIQGTQVFALVQDYLTKPESKGFWEAHRRYIDLQFLVTGRERIGFGRTARMVLRSHDEERDLSVLDGSGEFVEIGDGCFVLLWPDDAHMPGLQVSQPEPVRKIVVKIAVA